MTKQIQLGLKENWKQFTLLVVVNAFVGGMIGLERAIFPKFAEQAFEITSKTAILSFIAAFGISKAITNYFTGKLAGRFGRKNLLVWGWVIALPVPFILIYADIWAWVIFSNVLLGINQGLAWSSTVVMKIDLIGEKNRGLAMGINEFAGYLAVGLMAFASVWVANTYGISPYPFYLGIGIAFTGLVISVLFVKDTKWHVHHETQQSMSSKKKLKNVFKETTFLHKDLSSITQAGLVNNLNDGMIWGLLPILLVELGFKENKIGMLVAIYPTVWGIGQLFTGKMSDIYSKKYILFWGMFAQGIAIVLLPFCSEMWNIVVLTALLGIGTALVYPAFLSGVAQVSHPEQRAESLGIFRFWRDMGYAIGAILSGIIADLLGLEYAIASIGAITCLSAGIIWLRMDSKL